MAEVRSDDELSLCSHACKYTMRPRRVHSAVRWKRHVPWCTVMKTIDARAHRRGM